MLEFSGETFCRLSSVIGQMIIILASDRLPSTREFGGSLGELEYQADRLQLRSTAKQLGRIKEQFLSGKATAQILHPMVLELYNRLRDEMEDRTLLALDASHVGYFLQTEPLFGSKVAATFASVSYEIAEAGKCLALERSTASAFHSIRCLEAGIRGMSRCLGIPDPSKGAQRSWANLLRSMKEEMDRRWPPNLIHTGDAQFFAEAYAALAGMQNPWRNSTMHLDQTYTPEDAKHIFDVVSGFMKKLASRMDEDGNPKA